MARNILENDASISMLNNWKLIKQSEIFKVIWRRNEITLASVTEQIYIFDICTNAQCNNAMIRQCQWHAAWPQSLVAFWRPRKGEIIRRHATLRDIIEYVLLRLRAKVVLRQMNKSNKERRYSVTMRHGEMKLNYNRKLRFLALYSYTTCKAILWTSRNNFEAKSSARSLRRWRWPL